ncbi:diguanylate cyclase [bacterium]|nr:diguanylate cyclase [bacterium]
MEQKRAKIVKETQKAIAAGDYTKVILRLEDALAGDSKWKEGYKILGQVYLQLKNYVNAAKAYGRYVAICPEDEAMKREYGKCLIEASELDKAQEVWQSIFEKDANDYEAVYYLALVAYNQNYLSEASKMVKDACMLKSDYYEAIALQVKIDTRAHKYFDARKNLNYLIETLPDDSPILADLETLEKDVSDGVRNVWILFGVCLLLVAGVIAAAFHIKRMSTKVRIRPAPADMDSMSETSICRYVLGHVMNITRLPRGLCWVMQLDGRHMNLALSELITDTGVFSMRNVNKNSVEDFVSNLGKEPFMYKSVCKDALFQETFPGLTDALKDIEINVGVPIVWQDELFGLILLGRSRNSNKDEDRRNFENGIERIKYVTEEGAVALDRLFKSRKRNFDTRTCLYNREYFESQLVDMSMGCNVIEAPLCAFMMVVDQAKEVLENNEEEVGNEFLYEVANNLQNGVAKEDNVALCHLDNGVFGLVAPECNADDGIRLAKTLQTAMSQIKVPNKEELTTGSVAWAMFPEDSKDPKMLRSVLNRAFREIRAAGGSQIARAQKVEDATKEASVQTVEQPEEKLVVTRRVNARSDAAVPVNVTFNPTVSRPKPTGNQPLTPPTRLAAPVPGAAAAPAQEAPSSGIHRNAVSLNMSGVSAGANHIGAIGGGRSNFGEGTQGAPSSGPARLTIPSRRFQADTNFEVDIKLDEEGIDSITQFCGEEIFFDVVDSEILSMSDSESTFSMIYIRFVNLPELYKKGKEEYMRIRKDVSGVIQAFLGDDDIPGLIGKDDFAVLCVGIGKEQAKSKAESISAALVSSHSAASAAFGIIDIKGSDTTGKDLIVKAKKLADSAGVHV